MSCREAPPASAREGILVGLDADGHYTSFVDDLRSRKSDLPFDRFEMAQELVQEMDAAQRTTVQTHARFAELPTVTAIGTNVLAPVVDSGRLSPELQGDKLKGFQAGSF